MVRYITGVSNEAVRAVAHRRNIGLLCQPGNGYLAQTKHYPYWAADNGCFAQGEAFNVEAYLDWLRSAQDRAHSCLWATAPDVVGSMVKTWERSRAILPRIRELGFPVALVGQNGLRYDPPTDSLWICGEDRDPATFTGVTIPWDAFDCLFLGGDNRWKLGLVRQHWLVFAAKQHGKLVHMGRVNSAARLQQAEWFDCDTADGTYLAFAGRGAKQQLAVNTIVSWIEQLLILHPTPTLEGTR